MAEREPVAKPASVTAGILTGTMQVGERVVAVEAAHLGASEESRQTFMFRRHIGRVGFAADRFLVYGIGGLAFGGGDGSKASAFLASDPEVANHFPGIGGEHNRVARRSRSSRWVRCGWGRSNLHDRRG